MEWALGKGGQLRVAALGKLPKKNRSSLSNSFFRVSGWGPKLFEAWLSYELHANPEFSSSVLGAWGSPMAGFQPFKCLKHGCLQKGFFEVSLLADPSQPQHSGFALRLWFVSPRAGQD